MFHVKQNGNKNSRLSSPAFGFHFLLFFAFWRLWTRRGRAAHRPKIWSARASKAEVNLRKAASNIAPINVASVRLRNS